MTGPAPLRGQITRRTLLLAGAGVAATAAIPDIALAAKEKVLGKSHLDRSAWEPLVGTQLDVRNRGFTPVPVTLVKVGDLSPVKQTDGYKERAFYLVFQGPADAPLAADTHTIKVPGIGKVNVWFSSARQVPEGWEYVAVFANAKVRARAPKKPRAKGSRKQGRRSGRKAKDRKKDPKRTPERKPEKREPAPVPKAEAAPQPAEPVAP
jgi:hypothetical protein